MDRSYLPSIVVFALLTGQAHAVTLEQCTRLTNPNHGGEHGHVDLSEGRVMWRDWWSLEGSATNYVLNDCETGQTLDLRVAEANMHPERTSFDRRDEALEVIEFHESGARAFATFERMAADLKRIARDITISTSPNESCACAALYPDFTGEKTVFELAE